MEICSLPLSHCEKPCPKLEGCSGRIIPTPYCDIEDQMRTFSRTKYVYVDHGWETRCLLHYSTNKPLPYLVGLKKWDNSWVKPCPRGLLWRTRCNLLYMWITDGKHVACCIARQINPCHTGLSFNSGVIPGLSRAPEDFFGGQGAVCSLCESRMGNMLPAALLDK